MWYMFYGQFWPYKAVFRSFQRSSGQGQVKKGQIFKFINFDEKGIYHNQFWLRNLMVSFVFAYDPLKLQKSHLKKNDAINEYDFGDKNTPFRGQKLSCWLEMLYTGRRLVAE